MDNNETKEVKTPAVEQEPIKLREADYAAAIKEEVEKILKQREEEKNNSLDKKIEEEIERRLKDRQDNERERIESARRMIEEADRNAALEKELLANEKYNRISDWRKNKIREFEEAIDKLGMLGKNNMHRADFYEKYKSQTLQARRNDQRAQDALGFYNLTFAAMKLGGKGLRKAFFKNIGVNPGIED